MNQLWHRSLRQWIAIAFIVLFVLGMRILWPFLGPLSFALLLTYILIPIVNRVQSKMGWPRTAVAACVYLMLLVILSLIPLLFIPIIVEQVQGVAPPVIKGIEQLGTQIESFETQTILGQVIDPAELYSQLSSSLVNLITNFASSSFNFLFSMTTTFLSSLAWLLLILVVSFYLVNDAPNLKQYFWGLVPHQARQELYYLIRRIDQTWNAFLRGQLLLATVIFVVTSLTLIILGVPQPLFLGVLAGLLNLVPNIGPFLSCVPAIALAFIQGSTQFDTSNILFAIIVTISYILIQQVESQWLTPRIIGNSVNLHPTMIIIGAIIGFSAIGIFGIFLAAPTLASLRIISGYAYRKMLEPNYKPPLIDLPTEIAVIPDPRQRVMKPVVPLVNRTADLSLWHQWLARTFPPTPSEESQDA